MERINKEDFNDLADWWFRTFRRFTIPQRDLDKWLSKRHASGEDDQIRQRIERVLRAAARIAKEPPKKSLREIARRLVRDDRAEGYAEHSVRRILSGTYSAQEDRKIPGLRAWMRKRN
jgi:hypothetical protein